MADKIELNADIKSNIGEVAKDAGDLANEFKVMGVSLNDIKRGFRTMATTAKQSFSTVKAAIISTGIGALVVAVGSLITYFTRTKKGAELLEVAFAGLGAAVNVIVDRVAKFGGAIVKLFQGDAKGALKDVKSAFTGIGDEIVKDTKAAIDLKKAFVELRDAERDLNVETAERRAEIEALKLIAEDTTKSEAVRLKAAKDAFKIENDLLNDRIKLAEEALRVQREEMALGENLPEDLDKEAELRINLANIRQESTTKQIELNNKINAIQKEAETKRLERLQAIKDVNAEIVGELTKMPRLMEEANDEIILADNSVLDNYLANNKLKRKSDLDTFNFQLGIAAKFAGAMQNLAGENKALAIAESLINTYLAVSQVMSDKTIPSTNMKLVMSGIVLMNGLANVKRIASVDVGSGGGGGVPGATAEPPAPQFVGSGTFNLSGVQPRTEPIQTYVVTDDMTNSQNKLALIRRRATI